MTAPTHLVQTHYQPLRPDTPVVASSAAAYVGAWVEF